MHVCARTCHFLSMELPFTPLRLPDLSLKGEWFSLTLPPGRQGLRRFLAGSGCHFCSQNNQVRLMKKAIAKGGVKQKAKSAKLAGNADVALEAGDVSDVAPAVDNRINGNLLVRMQGHVRAIFDCPSFENIQEQQPSQIGEGLGMQDPFDIGKCKKGLDASGKAYKAAINIWSLDIMQLPTPGVPIMANAIQKLREHHFGQPAVLPLDIVVGVESSDAANKALQDRALKQVSAPELVFAYIEAVALDLKKGDEELMAKWRQTMLCCPCLFRKVESKDEMHQLSIQFREDLAQAYSSMRYTAVQNMFDIKSVMARKMASTGGVSAQKLAEYYTSSIRFADNSEKITAEFVDCALTVLRRLMSIPACAKMVMELEELGASNPMDSIYKLHKVVTRAGSPERIEWAFELMLDLWKSGALKSDQLSIRHLDVRGLGANGKGIIDLLCFKKEVLRHLTGELLDSNSFSSSQKQTLRDVCNGGISRFREKCGYVYNAKFMKVDLQWRAKLSQPEELLLSLIENVVFSTEVDSALRTALRNRKDVASMLSTQPLSGLIEDITDSLKSANKSDEFVIQGDAEVEEVEGEVDPATSASMSEVLPSDVSTEVARVAKTSDTNKGQMDNFIAACWRKVDTHVLLLQEGADASSLCDRLKDTEVNKLRQGEQAKTTNDRRFVLIVYDLKSGGESASHASSRLPPLRNNGEHLKMCLRASIDAVENGTMMGEEDLYLLFDGGRPGLKSNLLAGFLAPDGTMLAKSPRMLYFNMDEETYLARFGKVRGFNYNLTETCYCVTRDQLDMPVKRRKYFPGTNRNNVLGPISCPAYTNDHHNMVTWKEKK